MQDAKKHSSLTYRPLYRQIKESIIKRLSVGEWAPGVFLPSEISLAEEYGVSQGTIRKALDELTNEKIVVRYQGKGTAVATHDRTRSLFQFFRLTCSDGRRQIPSSRVIKVTKGKAAAAEQQALGLDPGAAVVRIERVRVLDERPVMNERITLPGQRFAGLATIPLEELPNTLYDLYQRRFATSVGKAVERLSAVAADATDSERLNVEEGSPLLQISRVAYDLEQSPVELRVSRCDTATHHYFNELI